MTKPAKNSTITDTLFLAKLASSTRGVFGWGSSVDSVEVREAAMAKLNEFARQGLIELGHSSSQHTGYEVTASGRATAEHVTASALCGPQATGAGRAKAAMWLWLVLTGFETGSWGDRDVWGSRGEIAHIVLCGLDLDASAPVVDDEWTSVNDSYDSGTRHVGASGKATCRCGQVEGYTIHAEAGSMIDMMTALLAYTD